MKHSAKILFLFLTAGFCFSGGAFQLDWSGYYKSQLLYIYSMTDKKPVPGYAPYSDHDLTLSAQARVSDGLEALSQLSLVSDTSPWGMRGLSYPKGAVPSGDFSSARMEAELFYGSFSGEYFKALFGRQPFEFGLGMKHSSGSHPNHIVYDARDALSFEVQANSFFIKPYLVFDKKKVSASLMAGLDEKNYGLHILYSLYKSKKSDMNAYGYFRHAPWSLEAEWGAVQGEKGFSSMAGVVELGLKLPFYNIQTLLIGGYTSADKKDTEGMNEAYTLNANYNPTFMFFDLLNGAKEEKDRTPGISASAFLTFYAEAPVLGHFKLIFLNTVMKDSPLKPFDLHGNEVTASIAYESKKGFVWGNTLAFFKEFGGKNYLGALTRASLRF